ncbi:MAG: hypothetical protein Q9217_003312 [Psora testacea]
MDCLNQSTTALTPSSTPPTPNPNHLCDIFSDSPPRSPMSLNLRSMEPSDIPRLRSTHSTIGYRAGISGAKEQFLQPGFDEAYSLGATFGLRVGYLLGVLEGLVAALSCPSREIANEERDRVRGLLGEGRRELSLEMVFNRDLWGEDGVWRYDVHSEKYDKDGEADITFREVVEWHPVVRKWAAVVEKEMQKAAVGTGRFEGAEWERGEFSRAHRVEEA